MKHQHYRKSIDRESREFMREVKETVNKESKLKALMLLFGKIHQRPWFKNALEFQHKLYGKLRRVATKKK